MRQTTYKELNRILVLELRRCRDENSFGLQNLDHGFLEEVILSDPAYLDYLLEVFKEIGINTENSTLPRYYHQWSSLLAQLGIDYTLITEATSASLQRVNQKAQTHEYLDLEDFREFLFLVIIAHAYRN